MRTTKSLTITLTEGELQRILSGKEIIWAAENEDITIRKDTKTSSSLGSVL